ncbi:hypothetical protein IVB38_25780 [Bradyrhizobium sp. 38]|nr:hypothetical protein [Bradyrhizobium sp. 38]MCK1779908.1 hypothetical protein [Bradyrhizobium sp. 132]
MAGSTIRSARSLEEFGKSFNGRIEALSNAFHAHRRRPGACRLARSLGERISYVYRRKQRPCFVGRA